MIVVEQWLPAHISFKSDGQALRGLLEERVELGRGLRDRSNSVLEQGLQTLSRGSP